MIDASLVLLPGDGVGPEVIGAARRVLASVGERFGHKWHFKEALIGGCAMDAGEQPLPEETLALCRESDAVLLGAVGGPKWDDPTAEQRPEQGLLALRKQLALFANLRPVRPHPSLTSASPVRRERLEGVDLLVIRELTGGIYFGRPRERRTLDGEVLAVDTMCYSTSEVRRVARLAFEAAAGRRRKLTSVDKANVLETSRLWRQVVGQVAADYPTVELEHMLVDAAAMHLISRPSTFDVILTANMFGDILTDEASMLSGSMGNLPSASLGEGRNRFGRPRGLYEPIHGSAPDIAGLGIANPFGAILSAAMLLRLSLGLEGEALAVEDAVSETLIAGHRTVDLATAGESTLTTMEITSLITRRLLAEKIGEHHDT